MELDAISGIDGSRCPEFTIYVSFKDNNPGNGDVSTDMKHLESFLPSDFSRRENGYLSLTAKLKSEVNSSIPPAKYGRI